jgi:hypothetical protein
MRLFHPARAVSSLALAAALGLTGPAGAAGIRYTGGHGDTVYGVAPYDVGPQAAPAFILNDVTGFNDILATPGHGFLLADPSIPHNISEFVGPVLPLRTFQNGGGNASGPFGRGSTAVLGPRVAFRLSDSFPAGGSASYSISSWVADFTVNPGGFVGNLGTFLAIGGRNPAFGSAAAASLVSDYYLNGVFQGQTSPLILAAAGNGNFQALGGSGAVMRLGPGGRFRGLAIDNVPAALAAGTKIEVVTTLTEYADPSSFSTIDITPDLLDLVGAPLPDFSFASAAGSIPEPGVWSLLLAGFFGLGQMVRRRLRRRARASA